MQLTVPGTKHGIEIIVVDNNSNDATSELVKGLVPNCCFEMRYIFEGQQGISAARNRAVAEARGDYLAFLDDECVVSSDWLTKAISDIEQYHPSIIGGPYIGAFLPGAIEAPNWFKIEYGNAYFLEHRYERGFQDGFRASSGNMFVRRDVFDSVRFDVNMGPKGRQVKVGEEVDLQERFLLTHPSEKVFYEPAIAVQHFILPPKMSLSYYARRVFASAFSSPGDVTHTKAVLAFGKVAAGVVFTLGRCIWRDRAIYPFWQNVVYERVIPRTCLHAGTVAKYLHDRFSRRRQLESGR